MAHRRSAMGLLPLLAVGTASSFADRREALNASDRSDAAVDCVSTAALLVFRGLGAGLAWTVAADGYEMTRTTDAQWKQILATRPGSSIPREAARTLTRLCALNMMGFASFLGIYGGVSCRLEKVRGQDDLLNSFAGGFTAALIVMSAELRGRKLAKAALIYGSYSMALHYITSLGNAKTDNASE